MFTWVKVYTYTELHVAVLGIDDGMMDVQCQSGRWDTLVRVVGGVPSSAALSGS